MTPPIIDPHEGRPYLRDRLDDGPEKPLPRPARRDVVGPIVAAVLVAALIALVLSALLLGLVSIWRVIL